MKHASSIIAAALSLGLLSACAPLIFAGTSATGANTFSQERSAATTVDDLSIDLGIERRMFQKSGELFQNVDVEVVEGRVLLSGAVANAQDAVEAVRIAWTVPGVSEVLNEIQVGQDRNWKNRTQDVWIQAQINSRLLFEKGLKNQNYNVEVVNGTVYLMGIAQDQAELNKALTIARTTQYVQKVVSYVRLKDDPARYSDAPATATTIQSQPNY